MNSTIKIERIRELEKTETSGSNGVFKKERNKVFRVLTNNQHMEFNNLWDQCDWKTLVNEGGEIRVAREVRDSVAGLNATATRKQKLSTQQLAFIAM